MEGFPRGKWAFLLFAFSGTSFFCLKINYHVFFIHFSWRIISRLGKQQMGRQSKVTCVQVPRFKSDLVGSERVNKAHETRQNFQQMIKKK